jgi:hypothetical protein
VHPDGTKVYLTAQRTDTAAEDLLYVVSTSNWTTIGSPVSVQTNLVAPVVRQIPGVGM